MEIPEIGQCGYEISFARNDKKIKVIRTKKTKKISASTFSTANRRFVRLQKELYREAVQFVEKARLDNHIFQYGVDYEGNWYGFD